MGKSSNTPTDFSDIADRDIPMPPNYTGSQKDFTIMANADGRYVDTDNDRNDPNLRRG